MGPEQKAWSSFHLLRIFSFTCFTHIAENVQPDCLRSRWWRWGMSRFPVLQGGNTSYLNTAKWRIASIYWMLAVSQGSKCSTHISSRLLRHPFMIATIVIPILQVGKSHLREGADNLLEVSQLAGGRAGPSWPRASTFTCNTMLCLTCHCSVGGLVRWWQRGDSVRLPHVPSQFLQDG